MTQTERKTRSPRSLALLVVAAALGWPGLQPARADAATTTIFDLARAGDAASVEQALASGTDVNVRDALGQTPIVVAALAGQDAVAQVLLSHGADVMARTVHAATFSGDLEILKLLLAAGAAINDQDNFAHITALHAAAEENHTAVVEALIQTKGADPALVDVKCYSAGTMAGGSRIGTLSKFLSPMATSANPKLSSVLGSSRNAPIWPLRPNPASPIDGTIMKNTVLKSVTLDCASASLLLLLAGSAMAQNLREGDIDTNYFGNLALEGYDAVANFTVGKATLGDPAITAQWLGAEWHFASAANRDAFMADPISYAPQYGRHCADGMARDATAVQSNIDPNAWRVINGKLYISYDPVSASEFDTIPDLIQRADANWATYQASHPVK